MKHKTWAEAVMDYVLNGGEMPNLGLWMEEVPMPINKQEHENI